MSTYSILVFVGSLRKDSFNRKFAAAVTRLAPLGFSFNLAEIGDLPLYNQDDDGNQAPAVRRLKQQIQAADGLMFATPEYNRSIPGVLKNAIDHASRPKGASSWAGKPAGILGVSLGSIGTALAQQHLRAVLACLDVPVMGQPEIYLQLRDDTFGDDGDLEPAARKLLQRWMDTYAAWVVKHA